ncbi:ROK family protein [Pseudalkalibacillus sp. A8]|uniref:ROK family protein n=1 Tax=Pseudalkalibacillus sp. A8 TaxID=3382641 RepID=UPI0038B6295E
MEQGYIVMDVGGTNIKTAVLNYDGIPVFRDTFDTQANESAGNIVNNFVSIIQRLNKKSKLDIIGIGMAFPGPFDYENGISYMQNLGKFDQLYKLPFKKLLQEVIQKEGEFKKNIPIIFGNDATLFGYGVAHFDSVQLGEKILCITLGTGCGSAFMENGKISNENGIPKNGWIYNVPFKDGVIDDYLSARGLMRIVDEMKLKGYLDGSELFQASKAGDRKALEVFDKFGEIVNSAITPFITLFQPERIVFGGQIAKSGKYFLESLQKENRNIDIESLVDSSLYTMQGLLIELKKYS